MVNMEELEVEVAKVMQNLIDALNKKVQEVEFLKPESLLLGKIERQQMPERKYIVFGKEVDQDAMDVLHDLIKQPLQNVAEYCAKEGMNEESIKAATTAAVKGIIAGFKSVVDITSHQKQI
ncbi:hypothetical protein [Xenorhabdus sp. PB30.3]|uniref:hypothetical protein n=1 Tax=Xenorhabdus sp. PB30.3 TaxID=2788941 RepID=UPI001E5D62DB|nr:hypothetical protein [Xenorhabdus sp. PB30.3]MCC8379870.1 hypothetical protein [Xenorhabdus sp. PB30.3]